MTDKIICTGCGKKKDEYGYCEFDGKPFCQKCWTKHIDECKECQDKSDK